MKQNDYLNQDIGKIKGVGPAKLALLNKLGIYNIKDIVNYFPRDYEDRTKITSISDFEDGMSYLFIATVSSPVKVQRIRKNLNISSVIVTDDTGNCKLTFFNQVYIKTRLIEGCKYLFFGKVKKDYNMLQIEHPQIYNISDLNKIKGLYPIYPLTSRYNTKLFI